MKKALRITALVLGTALLSGWLWKATRPEPDPLPTVASVDLARYAGTWHEIASFPKWFQKGCHCTTAQYTLADGYVRVHNACRKGSATGDAKDVEGKAFPVPGSNNAKLKVQFFWPFKGDYWILDLAPDYSYALVGDPTRESLWILSRSPLMPPDDYEKLLAKATSLGFDVNMLQTTNQNCAGQ